ncbi:MAG: FtsW/RodA/SpoVE family cell cycle protein [Anaerolineae bacterium]
MSGLVFSLDAESTQRTRLEAVLLGIATAFVAVNTAALALLGLGGDSVLVQSLAWGVSAWGGWWYLAKRLPGRDPYLYPLVMFLAGWGLLLIDRLAPNFSDRQTVWLILSVIALCVTATTPWILRWLRRYRYLLLLFGLGLLISTIVLGRNPSGLVGAPALWLGVGGVFFQPSELLKIILVAFLASYLSDQYLTLRLNGNHWWQQAWMSPRILGPMLLMWSICVVVLVWQRDLGTAMLFFFIFIVLIYIASGQWWVLVSGLLLAGAAGAAAYVIFAVVRLRVDIWLNPWPDADGRAYQIVQSLMAFGSGGVFGQGIGRGAPSYIPVVHSDFVFAALAEEWGLLGVVTLLGVFSVVLMRGMRAAIDQQRNPFNVLLAAGLTTSLGVQTLLILGGVLRLLPLTGVTLPFVSYGGSSLLMSFVMVGLLLRLSCERD